MVVVLERTTTLMRFHISLAISKTINIITTFKRLKVCELIIRVHDVSNYFPYRSIILFK
jgi:hypothetical protein